MLSFESVSQPTDHGGMVEDVENWPRKIPEDVFHEGYLSFKVKGSYKYQTKWAVLRFESAMGPKRLELFEVGTQDKCFQINANIYPTTTIPFTQLLGFYPQHTIRIGLFPIQILLTYHKYQLATKTREEQQQWLTKLNTIVYGSPRPHRTYEYMVMIFPTKLSNEINLKGSYIFRVTEQSVYLISRDTSDHMTYTIPLCAIVKANHTVFMNSSTQFAPYSDRKSNIKVLALTIHGECDLKIGSYVFAATSAAEIVTIINERRLKSCNCAHRPHHIPIKAHQTLENGSHQPTTSPTFSVSVSTPSRHTICLEQNVEATQHSKRPQTQEKFSPSTEDNKSLIQITNLKTSHNGNEDKFIPASPTQISPLTSPRISPQTSPRISPKLRKSSFHPRLKFQTNTGSPTSPPSTKASVNATLSTDATYSTGKNAKRVHPKHANFRSLTLGVTRACTDPSLSLPEQPDKKLLLENTSAATIADNTSMASSSDHDYEDFDSKSDSTSHDYDDIVSPSESPQRHSPSPIPFTLPPPHSQTTYHAIPSPSTTCATPSPVTSRATSPPTSYDTSFPSTSRVTPPPTFCATPSHSAPYANLECVMCSKVHNWDDNTADYTSNNQEKELAVSPTLKRRSRSMGNASNQIPPIHPRKVSWQPTNTGSNFKEPSLTKHVNQHFRSHSSDRTSIPTTGNTNRQPTDHPHTVSTNLATHCFTKSFENVTPNGFSTSKGISPYELYASYESIVSNGPYEQIPQGKLPSIIVPIDATHFTSQSSRLNHFDSKSVALNDIKSTSHSRDVKEEYEAIKNSGPYERISNHHEFKSTHPEHNPAAKSIRPVPLPRRKKMLLDATLLVRTDSLDMSKCKSLTRTTTTPTEIGTIGKRSDSMGDLLDIRDNSDIYTNHPANDHMLRGTLSTSTIQLTSSHEHSVTKPTEDLHDCQHHVMNLQSPVEQPNTSPQALPYAMVWLDRI